MSLVDKLKSTTEATIQLTKKQVNKSFNYAKIQNGKLREKIDFKIQEKAILNLKAELAMRHKSFEDYNDIELEIMLTNEKNKIIDDLRTKSLVAALAILGLDFLV